MWVFLGWFFGFFFGWVFLGGFFIANPGSTRWMEAVPLRNMEASTCTDAFIANWVARFGVPATVTTDRGAQFTSALGMGACTSLGIKHMLTTAYPTLTATGWWRACTMHMQIKDALPARGAGPAWHSHLPWVLMGQRAAPKEDSGQWVTTHPPWPATGTTHAGSSTG